MKNAIINQRIVSGFIFLICLTILSLVVSCEKENSTTQKVETFIPAEVQAILDKGEYTVHSLEIPEEQIIYALEIDGQTEPVALCTSAGYQTGNVNGGTFYSRAFPCDDEAAKSAAIQDLLDQMGFSPSLCTGDCSGNKKCKPKTLRSPDSDDVDLELVESEEGCFYKATVQDGGGSAKLKADCNCI
jgi:hypothetical protein